MSHSILRGPLSFCLLILAFAAAPVRGEPAANSLESQLIGHWQLVGVDLSGNAPYGAKPQGSMFLDAGGHYSVIVISDGGARSIAYFGAYTVNAATHTIVYHVDGASQAAAVGRDEKRLIHIDGNQLVQQSLPAPGRPVLKVTWKRA
jgi:hypothetical protein